MASSGTYAYAPDISEFVEEAFERCDKDPRKLTPEHTSSARRSINLMFAEWSARGVRLFQVDKQTQTLTDGDYDYTPATGTLVIMESFIRRSGVDTPVTLISRAQYAAIPDKDQEGLPTMLHFDRGGNTYYLWAAPENSTDVLHYWRVRRMQDVTAAVETPDVPAIWFEALAAGLAAKLSLKFKPEKFTTLNALAENAFRIARGEDREHTDTSFSIGRR